jgi:hypothetical protein
MKRTTSNLQKAKTLLVQTLGFLVLSVFCISLVSGDVLTLTRSLTSQSLSFQVQASRSSPPRSTAPAQTAAPAENAAPAALATAGFGKGIQNPAGEGSLLKQVGGGTLDVSTGDNALTGLELFVSRIIGFLTVLGGIFFIVYFILGALSWVTAGGDTGKIQKARDQIVQGVIGLVVIVGSYAVIGIIGSVVGIDILNPAAQLRTIFGIQNIGI